jgi:hypothetical protein
MKHLLNLACIIAIAISSCTKSTDSPGSGNPVTPVTPVTPVPSVNWTAELKNTLWSGEYKYTTGKNQSLQPFSLLLSDDGKVTWADQDNERPFGTWKVDSSQINFTFPNSTTLSASLAKDKWSNLKSGAGTGFVIDHITSTVRPETSPLANTTWNGISNGNVFTLKFLKDDQVNFLWDGTSYYTGKYTISIAGIRFRNEDPNNTQKYYGIFQNGNAEINCLYHYSTLSFDIDGYAYWTAKK